MLPVCRLKQILRGIRDVIVLSSSGPDTPLPFGHYEGPWSGGGHADAHPSPSGGGGGKGKRGAFSRRRRTILLPGLPLSLLKKIKVCAICGRGFLFVCFRPLDLADCRDHLLEGGGRRVGEGRLFFFVQGRGVSRVVVGWHVVKPAENAVWGTPSRSACFSFFLAS